MSFSAHIYHFSYCDRNPLAKHKFFILKKKNHILKIAGIKTAILSDKNRRRRNFLSVFVKLKANVGDSSYKVVPQNSSISNNFAVFCCFLFTISNIIPIAPAFFSSTSLITSPGLDPLWSNYTGWPPTGRLSKGPLKINIHSFRSVICFWHYRPPSVSALPLFVLYSSIYPSPQPLYQYLNWAYTHTFGGIWYFRTLSACTLLLLVVQVIYFSKWFVIYIRRVEGCFMMQC